MANSEPVAPIMLDGAYCIELLPRRDPDGHKGTFGTVVCLAGSLDYAGAALLTSLSAVRGGAGLVALALPVSLQPIFAGRIPEVVTLGLAQQHDATDIDAGPALDMLTARAAAALVIGPGLAETEGYASLLVRLLATAGGPVVVDGSALNLLARSPSWWTDVARRCVLTPHPMEFERITGAAAGNSDDARQAACAAAAARFGHVVVLKGAHTVIAEPGGRVAISPFANAALATAGSGDVLAGLIGALLAQGATPFDAACLGVYLHGRAGERLSFRIGDAGLAASDLPLEIALARHELAAHSS